jgi:16S rRNA (guanine966-N2)-methyltransferase
LSPPATTQKHQLRIIGGQWRGRKLVIADVPGLRPTGDRIRETLFNWLMHDIAGSRCLDVFAGSGALGLECLSRGAAEITMLEKHSLAARQLRAHCELLQTTSAQVIQQDALLWLEQSENTKKFDLVFIDPPFAAKLWQATIDTLTNQQLLADNALVYIETPTNTAFLTPPDWQLHREKKSGNSHYRLFRKIQES